jgi:non-reducing end alpha-L-arabinofuranosidase
MLSKFKHTTMKSKSRFLVLLGFALLLPVAIMIMAMFKATNNTIPARPEGPCDIYAAAGTPCVAAHSSTRALYASYNGPLYQVMRQSDGKTLNIGVVKPSANDPGGYANATAQDAFCANTYCWVTILYDQSGKGNHLVQAPRGGFSGPAMGGFNNLPIADMAPVTLMGHKVYGIFIAPGMGLRWNDAKATAVDDQAEGQYWVISGHHYNSGCCYDYGNAETDSRDDGDGTMETTYFGNATPWYHGQAPGPWVMTDQENNLVGCVNPSPNDKYCADLPSITWRFVTAMADGEPHHWRSMGGDAQQGGLHTMFDGTRIKNDRSSYDPMRKQGAILLGNGGDNSNGSQGSFYEGAMTAAGTFPTQETNQKIQANIVAARYDVQRLSLTPADATDMPPRLQTFSPGSSQNSTIAFTNTTGAAVRDLTLSVSLPAGWKATVLNFKETSKKFAGPVAQGESVSATFTITSGLKTFNGDLVGKASWTNSATGQMQSETIVEKVRNVNPVKINEFRISDGSTDNSTNSFIELFNAGNGDIDISGWTLTHHPTQMPIFSSVKIPPGTKLAPRSFYLLGLSTSGLAVPARKGESSIYVRSTTGMSVGDKIEIGAGSNRETRRIADIINPPAPETSTSQPAFFRQPDPGSPTTIWQPLPEGPVITIPAGSTNIPVSSVTNFQVGQKMAIGYGATYPATAQVTEKYEMVTITQIGKPGTQAYLSKDAKAGDRNIKVSSVANISVGDKIRLDIDSKGHGIETITVTRVGTASVRNTLGGPLRDNEDAGTGLDLAEPLKFDHSSNIPFSARGTGISFQPATLFAHSSNEPVLPLGFIIKLDQPLANNHDINAVVLNEKVTTAGYQGAMKPNQWFGGPVLSFNAGVILLRDAGGNVVDGLNYGGLVDPWLAEGYQSTSGSGQSGCFVPSPGIGGGFRQGGSQTALPNRSVGRFPDGYDTDNNCGDFALQNTTAIAFPSVAGSNNIKVSSVSGFGIGQKIVIGSGSNSETAVIATIGTSGGTSITAAAEAGAKVLLVRSVAGFSAGQTITVGSGSDIETGTIASIAAARRRFGNQANNVADSIMITVALKYAHDIGTQVSGSGITMAAPLTKAHDSGAPVGSHLPTPGEPNQYARKP